MRSHEEEFFKNYVKNFNRREFLIKKFGLWAVKKYLMRFCEF